MTNGEKIKEIFPSMPINVSEDTVYCGKSKAYIGEFSKEWWNAEYKAPTTKNDLGVDCIDRAELLKAMDTWDKFGYLANHGLIRLGKENKYYVQYVKYDNMVKCVNDMPSVTPQEPRRGHCITTRTFMHDGEFYCDRCKSEAPNNKKWDYCPNCGARMVETQESENKE